MIAAATISGVDRRIINVGSGRETSVNDVAEMVAQVTGRRVEVLHSPADSGGVSRLCADVALARRVLGYEPQTSLRQGLQLTLERDARFANDTAGT